MYTLNRLGNNLRTRRETLKLKWSQMREHDDIDISSIIREMRRKENTIENIGWKSYSHSTLTT